MTAGVKPKSLWVCKVHRDNGDDRCWSCSVSIDFNVAHRKCHCGESATGYRALSSDADVEFFCDDHFIGIDQPMITGGPHAG